MNNRLRALLALGSVIIYLLCFAPAYSFAGMAAAALIALPVTMIGGLFGIRAGLICGLLSAPANGLMFTWVGQPVASNLAGLLLGGLVFTGEGTLVGLLREFTTRFRRQAHELEREHEVLREEIAKREEVEAQLAHDVLHDSLTNLPNRTLFIDRLGRALQRAKLRQHDAFAVLFLDLDRFKVINDSLGHGAGDQVLTEVAHRLVNAVGTLNTVARLGGDEFAILLEDAQDADEAARVAEQIHHALSAPFDLSGHPITISASIGIVSNGPDYAQPGDVLQDADTAMYSAKAQGKGRHEVFNTTMRDRAVARLVLEADLKKALERHEFKVHYQPILRLHDKQLTGFEALLRWEHPTRGTLHPLDFIAVAEEIGIMTTINWWVMREACHQMYEWQTQFPSAQNLTISVNISPQHLTQPDFAQCIERILRETDLAPRHLLLELTEKVIVDDSQLIARILDQLQVLGVKVQIDDFGTGYSSLSYLQNLPAETLKIDRSFISRMEESRDGAELIRAIVALGRALGMKVIAEGIETTDQLTRLKELDCEYGQGYLFAKPIDGQAAGTFISDSLTSK
jgi:diguanylate cyclase (GGDEF)-like protein